MAIKFIIIIPFYLLNSSNDHFVIWFLLDLIVENYYLHAVETIFAQGEEVQL